MPFVAGNVVVRQVDARFWELQEQLVYRGTDQEFTVPAGFVTDFASIPRLVVWLIPRYGVYTKAAILHDFVSGGDEVNHADADGLFRRALRELGVSVPRRWMMWAAVRVASGLRGADAKEWLRFLVVAPLSLALVAVPALVVQLFLVLFWLVELAFWIVGRALRHGPEQPRPRMGPRTA